MQNGNLLPNKISSFEGSHQVDSSQLELAASEQLLAPPQLTLAPLFNVLSAYRPGLLHCYDW